MTKSGIHLRGQATTAEFPANVVGWLQMFRTTKKPIDSTILVRLAYSLSFAFVTLIFYRALSMIVEKVYLAQRSPCSMSSGKTI